MKTKLLYFTILATFALLGCEKNAKPQEENLGACSVEDPLADLPWMKAFIDGYSKDAEAGYRHHARIYQSSYGNGKTGFLIEICVGCPDAGVSLYDCEGNLLCVMWGIAGLSCEEFGFDVDNPKLIWEMK
jgi:hypothetical protein